MTSNGNSSLQVLRKQERQARQDLILDAAVRLFARLPYRQVGMREIAAEAGMSAASLYRYFTDRDQLFVEAMYRESLAMGQGLRQWLGADGQASLDEMAKGFVNYLREHDAFFQMMTHFMVDGVMTAESLERLNQTERRLLDIFEQAFQDLGAPAGRSRLLSHAFFAALNGVLITFRNYPGRQPQETQRHMERLALLLAGLFRAGAQEQTP